MADISKPRVVPAEYIAILQQASVDPEYPISEEGRPLRPQDLPTSNCKFLATWRRARVKLLALYLFRKSIKDTEKVPCFLFSPKSKSKNIWNIILSILLIYTATVMPFSMAFVDIQRWDDWFILDLVIDGLFFIDVLVNICSAYHDQEGKLITARKLILWNYFKSWMLIDLLACFPFGLIENDDDGSQRSGSGDYNNLLRLMRLPRLYRLVRISRLIKLIKHYKNCEFIERIQDFLSIKHSFMRLLGSFMTILLCVHIVTCFWYYTAKLEGFHPDTWVVRGGYIDSDTSTLYITSMYWCFTTLSTVGYGDIVPFTSLEKIMSIAWMIFGIYFISFTIGSLSSMLSNIDTKENALVEKLAVIDEFAKEANLNKKLKLELRHALRYSTEKTGFSWTDKQSIFNELPRSLKHNIAKEMHRGATKSLNFFKQKDQAMVADIVPFLVPAYFANNDTIYKAQEHADEIYFIVKGSVSYKVENREIDKVFQEEEFGDIEVVLSLPRQYDTQTSEHCETLVMNRNLVSVLQTEYHDVWHIMKLNAKIKHNNMQKVKLKIELESESVYTSPEDLQVEIERQFRRLKKTEKNERLKDVRLQHEAVLKKREITLRDLYGITNNLYDYISKLDNETQNIKKTIDRLKSESNYPGPFSRNSIPDDYFDN